MKDIDMKVFGQLAHEILAGGVVRATKYLGPKLVVRATKRKYKRGARKTDNCEMVFTVGRPNYNEREFIKQLQKAGEPFPVRKIQLKVAK